MISSVIRRPFCDRVWCILSTFFSLTVLQCNIRAYYAKLYPYATKSENDSMLTVGIVVMVALPLIGYFDEHEYKIIHGIVSACFFLGTVIYAEMFTNRFNKYKAHFPAQIKNIERLYKLSHYMWIILGLFAISFPLGAAPPLWEWILGVMYLNFFSFASLDIDYYETVEPVTEEKKNE